MVSEIEEALKEILPFLKWHSPFEYKNQVLDHLLGMTGTSDGVSQLSKHLEVNKALMQLVLEDRSRDIKESGLKILVNLTTMSLSKPILTELTKKENIDALLTMTLDKTFVAANYSAMLLSNLTKESDHCQLAFTLMNQNNNFSMKAMLDAFCDLKYNENCVLHHIGSLVANLTLLKEARLMLLDKEGDIIQRLLPFTQFEQSTVRRHAVAAIIKNCLFETGLYSFF